MQQIQFDCHKSIALNPLPKGEKRTRDNRLVFSGTAKTVQLDRNDPRIEKMLASGSISRQTSGSGKSKAE